MGNPRVSTRTFTDGAAEYIKSENATLEVIEPVVVNIKGVIAGAVVEVQGLMGQAQDVILAPVTGTVAVTVAELAQIIAVAREHFFEKGFEGASMSAIAAQLGGSKRTLWSYFPSKEELFVITREDSYRLSVAIAIWIEFTSMEHLRLR